MFSSPSVAFACALLIASSVGCNRTPTQPSVQPTESTLGTIAIGDVAAVYGATLTASPACSQRLPGVALVRHFRATLYSNRSLRWSSPSVQEPPGHAQFSSGRLDGDRFSLVIGTKEDPQSDAFHGITEYVDKSSIITIAGTGTGVLKDGQITGTFEGDFNFYQRAPDGSGDALFCSAVDHSFVLEAPTPKLGATVVGTVLDADSLQPIAGATVEWAGLAEAWGDRGHGVRTDANGRYSEAVGGLGGPGAAEGEIVMRASHPGHTEAVQHVKLELGGVTKVDFQLKR